MNNKVLEQLKEEYNETLNRLQDLGDILAHCAEMDTSHCGQDAGECKVSCGDLEATVPCKNLLGMQVVRIDVPCDVCAMDTDDCVKVELVGGAYICLARPEQDEKPVISFDDEGNVMDDIKEKTEAFMNYLDSVVKG